MRSDDGRYRITLDSKHQMKFYDLKTDDLEFNPEKFVVTCGIFGLEKIMDAIFSVWTWIWMVWLVGIRGWFVAGHLWVILIAQIFFYTAYAFVSTLLVLATKRSLETFGLLAVYGGSSLSFAGVTLPVTENAPLFTKIWSNFIPYTHYAKLQTEQWVIGSPISTSLSPLFVLIIYCLICFVLSIVFFKIYVKGLKA